MLDFRVSQPDYNKSHTEEEAMRNHEDILSYFISQGGILPSLMRKYSSLGTRLVAWVTGEKPVLIIGGEPASGKSLLMGELALRFKELAELFPGLQSPPILISYDRVHYLFLKYLLSVDNTYNFLPEGETHPKVRKLITGILQDILLYAISDYRPKNTPIILEAPLIGSRGEDIVDRFSWEGMQVLIVHSPAMQSQILQQEKQLGREISAQPLAIRQIHKALLRQREMLGLPEQVQDSELIKSWEQWLSNREGLVLTWDPADDEAEFAYIKETLKRKGISPSPLAPPAINDFTISLIVETLEKIPDLKAFASEVTNYRLKFVEECLI